MLPGKKKFDAAGSNRIWRFYEVLHGQCAVEEKAEVLDSQRPGGTVV